MPHKQVLFGQAGRYSIFCVRLRRGVHCAVTRTDRSSFKNSWLWGYAYTHFNFSLSSDAGGNPVDELRKQGGDVHLEEENERVKSVQK